MIVDEEEIMFAPTYRFERDTREKYAYTKAKATGVSLHWCTRLFPVWFLSVSRVPKILKSNCSIEHTSQLTQNMFFALRSKSPCEDMLWCDTTNTGTRINLINFPFGHKEACEFRSFELINTKKNVWFLPEITCSLILNIPLCLNCHKVLPLKTVIFSTNACEMNLTPQTKYNLPSWCDRVLRKSYPLVHVVCQAYGEWFPLSTHFLYVSWHEFNCWVCKNDS